MGEQGEASGDQGVDEEAGHQVRAVHEGELRGGVRGGKGCVPRRPQGRIQGSQPGRIEGVQVPGVEKANARSGRFYLCRLISFLLTQMRGTTATGLVSVSEGRCSPWAAFTPASSRSLGFLH